MPTNLNGPIDNYNLDTSHVLLAMIRKIHSGKCLMNSNWETIARQVNKRLINNIDGLFPKEDII